MVNEIRALYSREEKVSSETGEAYRQSAYF